MVINMHSVMINRNYRKHTDVQITETNCPKGDTISALPVTGPHRVKYILMFAKINIRSYG